MTSTDLPHDGRGGYLYKSSISLPNYANTTVYTSYSAIDTYLLVSSASSTTFGVTFGACLMTLIHVAVFTTPDKRGRIIFNCIILGLALEIIRQLCGILAITRTGTNSAYFLLTSPSDTATDAENMAAEAANAYTNFSLGTQINSVIDALASILAFTAVQICFFVLVRAMMATTRRKIIRIVTISLVGLGFHAVVWRLVQCVWNTVNIFHRTFEVPPPFLIFGAEIAYTVSICAWCLVYGYLIIRSTLTRIRLGLEFKRGEARHVMFMTALESMIIPVMFVVMQWLSPSWFPESEYCVVPSILILLPFGTIWATSFDPTEAHRGHVGRYRPNEQNNSNTVSASNPTTTSSASAAPESPSQPLFNRRATPKPLHTTARSNALHIDTISPAQRTTPSTPTSRTLEDLYSDGDSEGTVRIRHQGAGPSKPRFPIQPFDETE